MDIQGMLLLVLGVVACFMGYSMFKGMLPLWGFLLAGYAGMIFVPMFLHINAIPPLVFRIIVFVVTGAIGAAVSKPLYYVIVFLSGAAFGALGGVFVGIFFDTGGVTSFRQLDSFSAMTFPPTPQSPVQFFCMIIAAVLMGVMAIYFQKFMITASSAYIGAAALVGGLSGVISSGFQTQGIGIALVMAWITVGAVGMFVQYQVLGDEV